MGLAVIVYFVVVGRQRPRDLPDVDGSSLHSGTATSRQRESPACATLVAPASHFPDGRVAPLTRPRMTPR